MIVQLEQLQTNEEKEEFLVKLSSDIYKQREKQFGEELISQIERFVTLSVIDRFWMDHLDAIENLRQGIGLRGYGQRDPLVEYKNEAFKMFEQLISSIDDEIVHRIYKIQVQSTPPPMPIHQNIVKKPAGGDIEVSKSSNRNASKVQPTQDNNKKPGRNDPCWCNSGKKYKRCHWPN